MSYQMDVQRCYDSNTMKLVLKVSPSVVSIMTNAEFWDSATKPTESRTSFISEVSGTIFSCEQDKSTGLYNSFIMTSADVIRQHIFEGGRYQSPSSRMNRHTHGKNFIQQVHVIPGTRGSVYKGEIVAYDDHYNIAVVLIKSDNKLPTASLMCIDDQISVGVPVTLDRNPNYSKMAPGDQVVVVGRQLNNWNDLIVSSGKYSADHLGAELNLPNLFRIGCRAITNGGPVLDSAGNVIGIAFGCISCTACLPINVFLKWWNHFKTYKEICRPCMGITVAGLLMAGIEILASIVHLYDITNGVIVEEVKNGSPAHVAGMRKNDIIFLCGGRPVRSFLEFFELIWDKKGKVVAAIGIRDGSLCSWTVKIELVEPEILLITVPAGHGLCPKELLQDTVLDTNSVGQSYCRAELWTEPISLPDAKNYFQGMAPVQKRLQPNRWRDSEPLSAGPCAFEIVSPPQDA